MFQYNETSSFIIISSEARNLPLLSPLMPRHSELSEEPCILRSTYIRHSEKPCI